MRCKNCKDKFTPKAFLQKYCMEKEECISVFLKGLREKQKKEEVKKCNVQKKSIAESIKTPAEFKNELQKLFNEFIRLRDQGKPCISCGCDMTNRKGDASHYYAVSIAPSLRFDEDNVHLSCVPCNQYKSGNLIEYGLRLPSRIGKERFDDLLNKKQLTIHLNVEDVKEKIILYKQKIKQLKK